MKYVDIYIAHRENIFRLCTSRGIISGLFAHAEALPRERDERGRAFTVARQEGAT